MKIINCNRSGDGLRHRDNQICSRHIMVFGEATQNKLSSLTFGVVGAGGLGSLIVEQLMRLFPRRLILIDGDTVELSNLNRLVGATPIEVDNGTRKVDLAVRNIHEFNTEQDVLPIHGDFLKIEHQKHFKKCDIIIGASDSVAARVATNRLCLAHGIL